MTRSSSQGDEHTKSQEMLHNLLQPDIDPRAKGQTLKGHLSMLVITAKGLRQMMKVRYFVYDRKVGRLKYFRTEDETDLLGEIDVQSATFCYDVTSDRNGEFTLW